MEHGIEPPKAETLEELGTKLSYLRYDALEVVLQALARGLNDQKLQDQYIGKKILGRLGHEAVGQVFLSAQTVSRMFAVSIRYMEEDVRTRPLKTKR